MEYNYRKAQESDIPFLVTAVIEAERSGSDLIPLARIFGLTEQQLYDCLVEIFHIETAGCELSLGSFLVAECQEQPVAAIATWIEGRNSQSSALLKSNLISYAFPRENLSRLENNQSLLEVFTIERAKDARQIEYVFVQKEHRGKHLINEMIRRIHLKDNKDVLKTQIQLWANNIAALKTYRKSGFKVVKEFKSEHEAVFQYFPCDTKLLVECRFPVDYIG